MKKTIYWDEDEYYPWYSFEDEPSYLSKKMEVDVKLWKKYQKASDKFWCLHNQLIDLTETNL